MTRPVIGIIGNHGILGDDYPVQATGMINIEAVSKVADGLPLMVPADPRYVDIPSVIEACDGFVFTGGRPNVHPKYYGEEETEKHGTFDQCRDLLTLDLIRTCVQRGQPVLGICRGFQEFNVAFGGTLHPEIRELPGRMNHRMPPDGTLAERFAPRHEITLTPGGIFARLFGAERVMVNSLHGQGIKEPGPRIVIEGLAVDGTPEAIHVKDAPGFALAVQWHPEYDAANNPVSRPLFHAFGEAARMWKRGERANPLAKSA